MITVTGLKSGGYLKLKGSKLVDRTEHENFLSLITSIEPADDLRLDKKAQLNIKQELGGHGPQS